MPRKLLSLSLCALVVSCSTVPSLWSRGHAHPVYSSLIAHEWGTFTSIAGSDGHAVTWYPLTGSTDLPAFVEHFRNVGFKRGLRGTVRMETPVLYFYDSREETVSVKVSFSQGIITEWYPHASHVGPDANIYDSTLYQSRSDGTISWNSVTVSPNSRPEFPRDASDNHYYAARMTSSTPLRVKTQAGEQQEKFLFYRGVATFPVPLFAKLNKSGELSIENPSALEFPSAVLFERRGDRAGYRIMDSLQEQNTMAMPELTASVDDLGRDLEGMLVSQGLYQDEAHAMIETWRGSWFEEGSRLLYIVPASLVNKVLPLSITPAPSQTVRVFVGRLELVTPATQKAVETALDAQDNATLKLYGRFLEPILETILQRGADQARAQKLYQALDSYRNSELALNPPQN
jgi:hypothetical protein